MAVRNVVVLVSGKRCSGKDFLVNVACSLWSTPDDDKPGVVAVRCFRASTTDLFKEDFADKCKDEIDLGRLRTDREYKETHRELMTAHWLEVKRDDPTRYCTRMLGQAHRVFSDNRENTQGSRNVHDRCVNLFFVTGIRYAWEIGFFEQALLHQREGTSVRLVRLRVEAPEEFKRRMGWQRSAMDDHETEIGLDSFASWDLVFTNDQPGSERAQCFLKEGLLPLVCP